MSKPVLLRIPMEALHPAPHLLQLPVCPICNASVSLETAKTDEEGTAIHEECYLLKVKLWRASGVA